MSIGKLESLNWLREQLAKKYQIKTQTFGPGRDQMKEVKILNRIVTWDQVNGITYEADPRHVEIILDQLNLQDAKPVTTPGTREEGRTQTDHQQPLEDTYTSKYRALVARFNYLAPDRPDIAYTVKELAKGMASPTWGDWCRLKRLGRYVKGFPRLQQRYEWQAQPSKVTTFSEADWAGCRETRKSTTGGCVTTGKHTIKGWSKTQSLIALSSGESELYATLKAAAETLGMLSMLKDLGWKLGGEIWSDANAAIGIIQRNGLGKTLHIDTGLLWIQQTAAQRRLTFHKVLGKDNPADLYTKYLDTQTANQHLSELAYQAASGRAAEAPKLHLLSKPLEDIHGVNVSICDWVNTIMEAMATTKAQLAAWRRRNMIGYVGERSYDKTNTTHDETSLDQQVLWGSKWQVQGYNGKGMQFYMPTAQPDHPWGSTRTFQSTAEQGTGVSWVHGLRHGVTMHPRGRHLREGMILLIHGGATHQNVDEHITPTNTRKGTVRMKEVSQDRDGNTWNRPVREWKTVTAGPSRPRTVETWSGIQTRPTFGEVYESENGNKEEESREKKDQPLLGRLAPGLKKTQCWPTGVENHDEKMTSTHRRTRARKRGRSTDTEEKVEGIEKINKFQNTEFTWHHYHWFHLRDVSRGSSTARGTQEPTESQQGTKQFGVAVFGKERYSAERRKHLQRTSSGAQYK